MATIFPVGNDYTTRDKASYLSRAIRAARQAFPNWTSQEAADWVTLFLESVATFGGFAAYYGNKNHREAHLVTCTDRTNAVRHARARNYSPRRRTASQATLAFTLDSAMAGDVAFEQGWTVRSKSISNAIAVQLLADMTITAGNLTGTVTGENSERHEESYIPTTQPSQQFSLSFGPFIAFDSFSDGASAAWTEVTSWKDSGADDFHYRILLDTDMNAVIEFGDGTKGKLPVGQVDVVYRSGGGEVTIGANQLTVPEFTVTDNLGNTALFSVTNTAAGTTGLAEETVAELQENVPAANRVGLSTVAREDYEINAKTVDGVARAMLLTSDQDSTMPENTGYLYLIGRGARYYTDGPYQPASPTSAQKSAVELIFTSTKPKTVTFRLYVLDPLWHQIDITARVKLATGASASDVDTAIRKNLQDFFAALNSDGTENTQIDFGFNYRDVDDNLDNELAWSDMFNAVRDATGVRAVDRDTFVPIDDEPIPINKFPTLGTVTLIDDATGLPLV
jgi:hypothetical protein